MRIIPHYVYEFKFIEPFNTDDYNGIYKVLAIYSFDELLINEIDLYSETYEPLGLNKDTDFYPKLPDIKDGKIYKLLKLNEKYEIIKYMPEYLIDGIPVASVKKYYDLAIALHVGIFDKYEEIETLRNDIEELAKYRTGIDTCEAVTYSVKEKWMSVDDYLDIENERKNLINDLKAIEDINKVYSDKVVDVSTKTYFEQAKMLTKRIQEIKSIISAYEATLINMS